MSEATTLPTVPPQPLSAPKPKVCHTFCLPGGSTWRIVLMYTVPIMLFSAVFNVPKFFEFRVIEEQLMAHDPITNSSMVTNETRFGFQPTRDKFL